MLAAFDPESLLQLVVLVLLGSGGLIKKFFSKEEEGKRPEAGEAVKQRRRAATGRRLGELEGGERGVPEKDPWQILMEGGDPRTAEGQAAAEEWEDGLEIEPFVEDVPVLSAAAATPEVSIEGPPLGGAFEAWESFGGAPDSEDPWDPGARIRASVSQDIEQHVAADVTAHVLADMAEGVRGEADLSVAKVEMKRRARRGWGAAVIAAEVLGRPIALRDLATHPDGLWGS